MHSASDFAQVTAFMLPINLFAAGVAVLVVFERLMDKINDDNEPDGFA